MSYVVTTGSTTTYTDGGWYSVPVDRPHAIRFRYLTRPTQKAPMLDNQLCPLCKNPAVRDEGGQDDLLDELHDHKPETEPSACVVTKWIPTGVILRIRVCATCGHIWASRTAPPVEVPCEPGK